MWYVQNLKCPFGCPPLLLTLACETFVSIAKVDCFIMCIGTSYSDLPRLAWGLFLNYSSTLPANLIGLWTIIRFSYRLIIFFQKILSVSGRNFNLFGE